MKPIRLYTLALLVFAVRPALAQTTSFTYQGKLSDAGIAAVGNYDLQFALFDNASGGSQIGNTQTLANVPVSSGIFSVLLDLGANAFPGANRFLEIRARVIGATSFTTLVPRQQITSAPYAVRALSSGTAENLASTASANLIQNSTTQQTGANFNISGNGTAAGTLSANIVNAATQYNLGNRSVLRAINSNLAVGDKAGAVISPMSGSNSFFGFEAGQKTGGGSFNAFFGANAGDKNVADTNSFFGASSGFETTTGTSNSFLGFLSGLVNISGSHNTIVGSEADVGSSDLTYATAIGPGSRVDQSNSIVLGSGAPESVNVGIGTTAPQSKLHVVGSSWFQGDNTPLPANAGKGIVIGFSGEQGYISAYDYGALIPLGGKNLLLNRSGGNVGIGTTTPQASLDVNGSAVFRPGGGREVSVTAPNGEAGVVFKDSLT